MSTPTRRAVVRAAAWAAPAIVTATATPAFATSNVINCTPVGCRKAKHPCPEYHLRPGCTEQVKAVTIGGVSAVQNRKGIWVAQIKSSKTALPVYIRTHRGTWTGVVAFPSCKGH